MNQDKYYVNLLNVELFEASGTIPLTTIPAPTGACIALIDVPINDREDVAIGDRNDIRARSEYDAMHRTRFSFTFETIDTSLET